MLGIELAAQLPHLNGFLDTSFREEEHADRPREHEGHAENEAPEHNEVEPARAAALDDLHAGRRDEEVRYREEHRGDAPLEAIALPEPPQQPGAGRESEHQSDDPVESAEYQGERE